MMWQLLFATIGVVFGSAANALIDRLPSEQSWVSGRSECDTCKHPLVWKDLLPVVSFVLLSGQCRYCKSPIPLRNLLVEVFLGVCFWVLAGIELPIVGGVILGGMLWVSTIIAVMDWETRLVSEVMVVTWGVLVLVYQLIGTEAGFQIANLGNNIVGFGLGLLVIGGIWAGSRGRAMGFGDVEIAVVMGWWLGWQNMLVAMWIAFVAGAAVGLLKIVNKQAKLKSEMAFGPFLVLGTWLAFVSGKNVWMVWGGW